MNIFNLICTHSKRGCVEAVPSEQSIPGAKAKSEKHSPVEAKDVTSDLRLLKYCERMVMVGRNVRQ